MMMMRAAMVTAGLILLAGCNVTDVKDLQAAKAQVGTPFTQALTDEYRAAATHEAEVEYEWNHAAIFARKGLKAARGEVVMPEELNAWGEIPAPRVGELSDARMRLVGYLNDGVRERVPAPAAKAQVMLDCWIEEETEGEVDSDCRAQFLKTEPLLQVKPVVAREPAPQVPGKIVKTFVVYFDLNKTDITAAAHNVLNQVVTAQAEIKPMNIYLGGHTDTVGGDVYNQNLSRNRAEVVAAALSTLGVKTSMFDVKYFGKHKPQVPTPDNTKEPKNRRVEIYFEK